MERFPYRDWIRWSAGSFFLLCVTYAVQCGVGAFVSHALGSDGRGVLAVAQLFPDVLFVAFGGITGAWFHRYQSELPSVSRSLAPLMILTGLLAGSGLLVAVAGLAIWPGLRPSWIGPQLLLLALMQFPFMLAHTFLSQVLQTARNVRYFIYMRHLPKWLSFAGIAGFGLFYSLTVSGMLWVSAVSYAVGVAGVLGYLCAAYGMVMDPQWAFQRRLLYKGLRLVPGAVAFFLLMRYPVWHLSRHATPQVVGEYALALSLVEALWLITVSLEAVTPPLLVQTDSTSRGRETEVAGRAAFWLTAGLALFLWIFSPTVVRWYGGGTFHGSILLLRVLLPGAAVFIWARFLILRELFAGRLGWASGVAVVGALIVIVGCVWGGGRVGPVAVAGLVSVAMVVESVLLLARYGREQKRSWQDLLFPAAKDFGALLRVFR